MLREYKAILAMMKSYTVELTDRFKSALYQFTDGSKNIEVIIFIKIKCAKEGCDGYAVMNNYNTALGQIKCTVCKHRVDSVTYKKR